MFQIPPLRLKRKTSTTHIPNTFISFAAEKPNMKWIRRKDLEGGKELGIWLKLKQEEDVVEELYVETHEYRGGNFDVYTATPSGEWTHLSEEQDVREAFEVAEQYIQDSGAKLK
jgi:hypothetical protein